jgi:hypothetical protein
MRSLRQPLLLTLASAVVGAAWLLWTQQATDAPPAGDPTVTEAIPTTEQAAVAASPPPPSETTAAAARTAAMPERPATPPIPADAPRIEIRIVDGASGAPVPNAAVAWFDPSVTTHLGRHPELLPCPYGTQADHEAMANLFGWQTRSDDRGVARIHLGSSTTVVARRGDDYGQLVVLRDHLPPPEGFELRLAPDHAVRIRVLDADGSPVLGAPVAWSIVSDAGKFYGFRQHGPEATTLAPDGIATLPHIQRWRGTYDFHARIGNRWHAALYWPGQETLGPRIDFDAPPTEPVELRLPPHGSVRARLADGAVAAARASGIELVVQPSDPQARHRFTLRGSPGTDGWTVFPRVPLGERWVARASIDGGSLETEFVGPVGQGAQVEVMIRERDDRALLAGRALDENRKPLAGCGLRFSLGEHENWSVTTDADGEFRFVMRPRTEAPAPLEARLRGQGADKRWRSAALSLRQIRAGIEPLGDVVLAPEPLLAAGRFLVVGRELGFPNAGAKVEFLATEATTTQWAYLPDHAFMRLSAERFEVRGPRERGRYRLRTTSRDFLPIAPMEFVPGTEDLVVELHPAASIAAVARMPDVGPVQVMARMVPTGDTPQLLDEPGRLVASGMRHSELRQQFSWRGIGAGNYRLEWLLVGFEAPILSIDDVQVPAPEGGDPRLLDVDLPSAVRVQEFLVQTPDNRPLRGGGAMFALPMTTRSQALTLIAPRGEAHRALLPMSAVDLLVAVPGFRPLTVRCSDAPVQLRLEPWPTIEVRLREPVTLPADCRLAVRLQPRERPRDWPETAYRATLPAWEAVPMLEGLAQVPIGDGVHDVSLELQQGPMRSPVTLEVGTPSVSLPNPTAVIDVPQAAIDRALRPAERNGGGTKYR